jgi:aarF domain-containing kinase
VYGASFFDTPLRDFRERGVRFGRVVYAVSGALLDERYTKWRQQGGARDSALDLRQATRLLNLASLNGFLFQKLGQYASAHPNTPPTYRAVLSQLQDRMPPRAGVDVVRVIEEDLGCDFSASPFATIEPQPIACASIAQVHRATLKDGTPVAVKVQHAELSRIAAADIAMMDFLFLGLHHLYPELEYMRVSWPLWRRTLLQELDFATEAQNGLRVARHFEKDARIHIPAIHAHATTQRLLTMEWVEGRTLREVLLAPPASPAEAHARLALASAVSDFFSQQVLLHGFVHCDPHPANLMVNERGQLVVVDHGMYRQLTPAFRRAFCALWLALLVQDVAAAAAAVAALGLLEGDAEALSQILLFRSARGGATGGGGSGSGSSSSTRLGAEKTKEQWAALRKEWEWVTPADVNAFAMRLPSDFSFCMRTIALARGLGGALGGTARDRLASWGHGALAGQRLTGRLQLAGALPLPVALQALPLPLLEPLAHLQQPGAGEVLRALAGAAASVFSTPPPPTLQQLQQKQQQQQRSAGGGAASSAGSRATESEVMRQAEEAWAQGSGGGGFGASVPALLWGWGWALVACAQDASLDALLWLLDLWAGLALARQH